MINKYKSFFLSAILLLVSTICIAQPGDPDEGPPPPPGTPIDSGILILLVAGALLGVYKLYLHSKNKKRQLEN